ncbi:hypothetical protein J4410_06590 [Candidatus Woesearchaeota archaeon]|nr:hypothetical protein [Candidatus Woesearchaeota archaeon]
MKEVIATIIVIFLFLGYAFFIFFFDFLIALFTVPLIFYFGNRWWGGLQSAKKRRVYLVSGSISLLVFFLALPLLIGLALFCVLAWGLGMLFLGIKEKRWFDKMKEKVAFELDF